MSRVIHLLIAVTVAVVATPVIYAQSSSRIETFPGTTWETRTPDQVGLDASKLSQMSSAVGGRGLIIKDGYVVHTWGSQTAKHDWLSAAKPVTSTLLMFAVQEGLLDSPDDLVAPYVEQSLSKSLVGKDTLITFAHFANMTSGYALPNDPSAGSRWGYNDYAIRLYSLLLADAVFETPLNTVITNNTRLGPLQFQDGSIYSTRQGLGVYTSVRDMARIGWFWLNRGYWNGTQLLGDEYFDLFSRVAVGPGVPQTSGGLNDYLGSGTYGGGTNQTSAGPDVYGYNLWVNANGNLWPDAPADTYQANGGWNQHALTVIPSLKIVVAWLQSASHSPESFAAPMNGYLKLLTEAAIIPLSIPSGWSQVSVPVKTSDMTLTGLFGNSVSDAYHFEHGVYVPVDTIEVGKGYLVKSTGISVNLSGEHVLPQRVPISEGWNLVGLFHNAVVTSGISSDPPGIIDSQVYDHLGKNDETVSVLAPGHAYWVRATADGYLVYSNAANNSAIAQ